MEQRIVLTTAVIHVDTFDDVVDPLDGLTSLREAIIETNFNPDRDYDIHLRPGTYRLTLADQSDYIGPSGSLEIRSRDRQVRILGAGLASTTIDAGGKTNVANSLNDSVFRVWGSASLYVEGLTVTGGTAGPYVPDDDYHVGGAFVVLWGNLFLSEVALIDNTATPAGNEQVGMGGAIYNTGGNVTIVDSTISSNQAAVGGAVANMGSPERPTTMISINSRISDNIASWGGGIANTGNATVINSFVTDNQTTSGSLYSRGWGGGIANSGDMTISNSTVSHNIAHVEDEGGVGGGLFNSGNMTVTTTTVSYNLAAIGGGIANSGLATVEKATISDNVTNGSVSVGGGIHNYGTMSIHASTVSHNAALGEFADDVVGFGHFGGGISNRQRMTIINTTISNNKTESGSGGGLHHHPDGELLIAHSTITGNRANEGNIGPYNPDSRHGGGLFVRGHVDVSESTVVMHNTIVAANYRGNAANDIGGVVHESSSYNLIGCCPSGPLNRGIDDRPGGLIPGVNGNVLLSHGTGINDVLNTTLADNGGPTLTHAILAESPAIDAGDPDFDPFDVTPPLIVDQRGYGRVAGGRIDIGAVEFNSAPVDDVTTPPQLRPVSVHPAFAPVPTGPTNSEPTALAPTTTKPLQYRVIVDVPPDELSQQRYSIVGVNWAIQHNDVGSLNVSPVTHIFTPLGLALPDWANNTVEFRATTQPGPGMHGPNSFVSATLWYRDIITGELKTAEKQHSFKLYFDKYGYDLKVLNETVTIPSLCSGAGADPQPPNWFYYWSQEQNKATSHSTEEYVVYRTLGATGYGRTYPSGCVALTQNSAGQFAKEWMEAVYGNVLVWVPSIPDEGFRGVSTVEHILAHERAHRWLYGKYGNVYGKMLPNGSRAPIGPNQTDCVRIHPTSGVSFPDSDCDGLPDELEDQLATLFPPQGNKGTFDKNDPRSIGNLPFTTSLAGTDEEAFAMLAAFGLLPPSLSADFQLQTAQHSNDWANPGKQTVPSFMRELLESGTSASLTGQIADTLLSDEEVGFSRGIRMDVGVNVDDEGSYSVGILLRSDDGSWYHRETLMELTPGVHMVGLLFEGQELRRDRNSGTFEVVETFLFGNNFIERREDPFTTNEYHFSQFLPKGSAEIHSVHGGYLSEPTSEETLDPTIEFTIDVTGFHEGEVVVVDGYLFDEGNQALAHGETQFVVEEGHNRVTLSFSTSDLRMNRVEGPLELRGVRLWQDGENIDAWWTPVSTREFALEEWGRPIVQFDGNFQMSPVDTNGNGAFDRLSVDLSVSVDEAGSYMVIGILAGEGGHHVHSFSVTADLQSGSQLISFDVGSEHFERERVNGPYRLTLLRVFDGEGKLADGHPTLIDDVEYSWSAFVFDVTPPLSSIDSDDTRSFSDSFVVRWTGEDPAGSELESPTGIATFEIFVAIDDGPVELWLVTSDPGEAVFTGTYGRRYEFFSIATDFSGNREPDEGLGRIEIEVVSPWRNELNPLDVDADGNVTPFDALVVVSWIHSAITTGEPSLVVSFETEEEREPPFPDVNGDGLVSPFDVLLIVSYLFARQNESETVLAEGEDSPVPLWWGLPSPIDLPSEVVHDARRTDNFFLGYPQIVNSLLPRGGTATTNGQRVANTERTDRTAARSRLLDSYAVGPDAMKVAPGNVFDEYFSTGVLARNMIDDVIDKFAEEVVRHRAKFLL